MKNTLWLKLFFWQIALAAGKTSMESSNVAGVKRKSITFEDTQFEKKKPNLGQQNNKKKQQRAGGVYAPPQGKYSANIGKVGKCEGNADMVPGCCKNTFVVFESSTLVSFLTFWFIFEA